MSFSTVPQLKERTVFTYASHKGTCIPRPVGNARSRPVEDFCDKWRKNWTEEGMEQAIKSITLRGMSVRKAAEPKSTIYDRLSGKVLPNLSCGAPKYLTDNEERELATFLIGCSRIGYGKTRSEGQMQEQRTQELHNTRELTTIGLNGMRGSPNNEAPWCVDSPAKIHLSDNVLLALSPS
uniref:Uncharacterized protein n=1 Tax=Amphimedon queenslandica TaxID=400682 RepID=A0A1X7TC00_AMPQE